jgi:hypothetical protein
MKPQAIKPPLPLRHPCRVEAWCIGIGWVVFCFADDLAEARQFAQQARFVGTKRWPGQPERRVRIVEVIRQEGLPDWEVTLKINEPVFKTFEEWRGLWRTGDGRCVGQEWQRSTSGSAGSAESSSDE